MVICAGLVPTGSARTISNKIKPKRPTAFELLDKYSQALDSTASFVSHYERTGECRGHFPGSKKFRYKQFKRGMFKFKENKGDYHHQYAWGYFNTYDKDVPEDKPIYRVWITAKDFSYFHQINKNRAQLGSATWEKNTRQRIKTPITSYVGISHLLGYVDSDERLDEVLRKADYISVRDKTEIIRGSVCFVIDAHTKYGQFSIWLDPNHSYHPVKIRHRAKEGEYLHHHIIPKGSIATGYLDVLQFKQVDDIWVPVEVNAGYHRTIGSPKYYMSEDKHYKRTQIILNPDHDKLGSFADPIFEDPNNDPELRNGTRVEINFLPTRYTWQDGKVVDKDGREVDVDKLIKAESEKVKKPKPKGK